MKINLTKHKAIKRLLICTFTGLLTSVGVAWMAAGNVGAFRHLSEQMTYNTERHNFKWAYEHNQGVLPTSTQMISYQESQAWVLLDSEGPWWNHVRQNLAIENLQYNQEYDLIVEVASGYPMVCLLATYRCKFTLPLSSWEIDSGITSGGDTRSLRRPRALPTQPIWLGLVVNTSIYAIVSWLVVVVCTWQRKLFLGRRFQVTVKK